ncbi:hypothetical protein IQ266_05605 [filamentous cyanobacterium LEGE 11480]|uniref:Uncharacterized protein n=1 Tax=Romeriopsis navalis LEGE 11480 TaxID=2777977 RepID=A0A928Z1D8_9CYAN|nr:hormogonium polysaccharide biosynthesis protein HpsA [Romeriopsis navalis]MBE9029236.1 hypothetical protein [Romeriopsis navalis LEGE 11480]
MTNRKFAKAMQNLAREVRKLYRQFNRAAINWLLRSAFVANRRGQSPVAGFILPTTVLLLLVLTLTVGAMTLRAFDRNTQVIANAQEKVIYNAATPAIDRARSKLEFLFDPSKDARYPGGTPFESFLVGMLTNDGTTNGVAKFTVKNSAGADVDPYTLPDEERIDIGSPTTATLDGNPDIAWRYRSDTDGDGTADATIVYSIIFETPEAQGGQTPPERLLTMTEQQKADAGIVRNGPISSQSRLTGCGNSSGAGDSGFTQEAWFEDVGNTSIIRKNFQVNTIVIPDNPKAATTTMEFQQDRQILRGNKWGAWFRYDLEIFPGPQFNWNGAMHTEGNMILGNNNFDAYLVSAPASCLYQPESSELSITNRTPPSGNDPDEPDLGDFQGMVVAGLVGKPQFRQGRADVHVQTNDTAPPTVRRLDQNNDSSTENAAVGNLASDPVEIVLEEKTKSVNNADDTNRSFNGWNTKLDGVLQERFNNSSQRVPFVDDLYRADDRWGPKPKYDDNAGGRIPDGASVGEDIPANDRLISTPPATGNASVAIGLDGYWERRARTEGLRVLVGERLELGNIGGWVTPRDVDRDDHIDPPASIDANNPPPLVGDKDAATPADLSEREGDPLYPPTVQPYPFTQGTTLPHLTQQRRSLRDNIPAVQSAAVYHAAVGNKDYPVACVAMTVHPGTQNTLRQSVNFFPTNFKDNDSNADTYLLSDFFSGRGTDGWEYAPPGDSESTFIAEIAPGRPLRQALDNLANFGGDPDGAFPPTQDANVIHPYPAMSMWGNQSNLRRALNRMNSSSYTALSVADKTYIHTAACSLGMLATNIDQVQKFDPTNVNNDVTWNNASAQVMSDLADRMTRLMDGQVENGEVLPKARLNTYNYNPAQNNPDTRLYKAEDYYEVPPEAFVAGLKQQTIKSGGDYLNDPVIRMAELIMNGHQIRRDRTFGFRPSPAFGEYGIAFNVNTADPVKLFPSACDPDLFALGDRTVPVKRHPTASGNRSELRENTSVDPTTWNFKPFAATPAAYSTETDFPGAVGGDLSTVSGRRLALSRLCGAIRVPRGYQPGDPTVLNSNDPALRPVVLPKFPSLYYIFPEVAHGLRGGFVDDPTDNGSSPEDVANTPLEWDHRQPGAIGTNRTVSTTVNNANDAAAAAAGLNPFDREPYVTDNYINTITVANDVFKPVSTTVSANPRLAAYPAPTSTDGTINPIPVATMQANPTDPFFSRLPYADSSPLPVADLPVTSLALAPRKIDGFPAAAANGVLPNYTPRDFQNDTSPNRIMIPSNANPASTQVSNLGNLPTKPWAVPFLDWALFDGRQLQTARITDIDWGMLRSTKPTAQTNDNTEFAPNEPWLPMSGIVYAFREDAVREDGIARPIGTSPITAVGVTNNQLIQGTAMNVSNPEQPSDPALQDKGISVKPIDHLPDPDRRIHGFRMRNATQLKRNPAVIAPIEEAKNVRGLSFFTDQPVYMMGNFNLHQEGTGNENTVGNLLEEFTQPLFPTTIAGLNSGGTYNYNTFYNDRVTKNPKFATSNEDRWRPTEILADAISILSNDFCEGSIADAFVGPATTSNSVPDFQASSGGNGNIQYPNNIQKSVYNDNGLYSVACDKGGNASTSYQNQNRVKQEPPDNARGWSWKREGASFVAPDGTTGTRPAWADFTTPIQIGRTGEPLVVARPIDKNETLPVNYGIGGLNRSYATPNEGRGNGRRLVARADNTSMNAIVVSGLSPSRIQQSYGGLHNFPRFLELWSSRRFFFAGSFLQLNFSNYATGPFEQEAWEPGQSPSNSEPIPHYAPPARLWGYDVALQFAPAGPAAARFVAPSSTRSEFYTEPPVSDPYINKLCVAAQNAGLSTACVAQQP